ncbi:MAG: hypothetical protein S4CHLAM37_15650 [Chlamydiia bacterium]|nr:hypothetical protein [Chlamydiia bacterium]
MAALTKLFAGESKGGKASLQKPESPLTSPNIDPTSEAALAAFLALKEPRKVSEKPIVDAVQKDPIVLTTDEKLADTFRATLQKKERPPLQEIDLICREELGSVVKPPRLMSQRLDFQKVEVGKSEYDSFSAWLFLTILGTETFMEMFRTQDVNEVGLNVVKGHSLKCFSRFRQRGFLDVKKLGYLLTRCNDTNRRGMRLVERTLALGDHAPVVDLGEHYPYHCRQVEEPSNEQPHAIEIMRNFLKHFDKTQKSFTSVTLLEEMHQTVQEFCDEEKPEVSSPCITFVRPEGWTASNTATIFPNEEITISGIKYKLKGVMVRRGDEVVTYDAHLFEDDAMFTYSSELSGTGGECYDEGCEPEIVFSSEQLYQDYMLETALRRGYRELVTRLVKESDMLLYVKVDTPSSIEEASPVSEG